MRSFSSKMHKKYVTVSAKFPFFVENLFCKQHVLKSSPYNLDTEETYIQYSATVHRYCFVVLHAQTT